MSKTSRPRTPPFSIRLTFDERARLARNAGTMPVAAYIKSLLFAEDAPRYRKARSSVKDQRALAEVLACLGASRIANNLNQLAHAANLGNLYFDEETKRDIRQAADDIRIMRELLLRALGMQTAADLPKESTSQSFTRASSPRRIVL